MTRRRGSVVDIVNCRRRHRHCSTSFCSNFSLQQAASTTYYDREANRRLAGIVLYLLRKKNQAMFKISIVENRSQRRLVVEGKLISPWTAEVESVWRSAGEDLQGRKLIIDLSNVTLIGVDGENTLFELMRDGARFTPGGVLTKHVLQQLARCCRLFASGCGNTDKHISE